MVDRIRALCKKNKTSIAALERDLGFGNGVIARWNKSAPNYERLSAVASALGVSVEYLRGEEKENEPAALGKLIPGYDLLTDENKEKARDYIALLLNSQQKP